MNILKLTDFSIGDLVEYESKYNTRDDVPKKYYGIVIKIKEVEDDPENPNVFIKYINSGARCTVRYGWNSAAGRLKILAKGAKGFPVNR
jgi:hypothetical protein